MATLRKLLVLTVACGAIASAGDFPLLNLVMPDAQALLGANVERILQSEIGRQIGTQIHGKAPELEQILEKTGFDPTKDLKEVLIAATSKGQNGPALVLVRGRFDPDKIRAAFNKTGRKTQIYQGVEIMENPSQSNGAFAFLDDTISVGGDLDQVQAAIRRRAHPTTLSPELTAQVAAMSERYDVWIVSAASPSKLAEGISGDQMNQAKELLKSIEQVSGGVKFSANLDLGLEMATRSAKDAEKLHDALQLIVAMAVAGQEGSKTVDLSALKVTTDAKTVRVAFTITAEQLKKASEMQLARMQHPTEPAEPPKPKVEETGVTIQSSERDMGTVVVSSSK